MVNIITDSTADLGRELPARYGIRVVPVLVHVAERTYKDGEDIEPDRLYGFVEEFGQLPKTAAPPVADFIDAFSAPGDSLYIGIAEKLSSSVLNAGIAAQSFPPGQVRVIDSLNLSTGIGLLVLRAAEMRDRGCSADAIEQEIRSLVPKVRTSFALDTLRYVYMGGRCTAVQSFMGSVLKIRPVLEVLPDGTLGIKERIRGPRKRALQALLDDFEVHVPEIDLRRVFVTHSGCTEDADFLAAEVKRIGSPDEVLVTRAGSVVSSHCGPNTIGILYLVK